MDGAAQPHLFSLQFVVQHQPDPRHFSVASAVVTATAPPHPDGCTFQACSSQSKQPQTWLLCRLWALQGYHVVPRCSVFPCFSVFFRVFRVSCVKTTLGKGQTHSQSFVYWRPTKQSWDGSAVFVVAKRSAEKSFFLPTDGKGRSPGRFSDSGSALWSAGTLPSSTFGSNPDASVATVTGRTTTQSVGWARLLDGGVERLC